MRQLLTGAMILLAGCATSAIAQDDETASAQSQTPPPCEGEHYRDFDFWIGEWRVADLAGTYQGRNLITAEEGGCLLVERWTSAQGTTGQSYNYYNPGTDEWRQIWVSGSIVIDYTGGLTDTGSMKLVGAITTRDGVSAPFTGEWTVNADGTVTQHFEQQDTETGEWAVWFTGVYTREEVDTGE